MSREEEGNPPGLSSLDWIHAILRARGMQNRYSLFNLLRRQNTVFLIVPD